MGVGRPGAAAVGNLDLLAGAAFLHDRDAVVDPGLHRRVIERRTAAGSAWVRAAALAEEATATAGIGVVAVAPDSRAAVEGADVVVTAASFGPVRQVMTGDWLAADALVVPVDYATYCAAEVARDYLTRAGVLK